MRTEVKIGVAAAVFIAAIAVVYVVLTRNSNTAKAPVTTGAQQPSTPAPPKDEVAVAPAAPSPGTAAPATPVEVPVVPSEPLPSPTAPPVPLPVAPSAASDAAPVVPPAGVADEHPLRVESPTAVPPAGSAAPAPVPSAGSASVPVPLPVSPAGPSAAAPARSYPESVAGPMGVGKEYVVEKGDSGFWRVSVKMYGDGKYYTLIRDANPTVDTNNLKPGTKLVIPPLPGRDSGSAGTAPSAVPSVGSAAVPSADIGGRYEVQKGDNGFWGIAEKIYRDGSLADLIQKANPGVDPTKLKIGQILVIPAKPATSSTISPAAPVTTVATPSGGGAATGSFVTESGKRYYVVASGDSGFWLISQKAYGDGKYYKAIEDANKGVSARSLKIGQKILVPELTDEMMRKYGAAAPVSSPASSPRTEPTPVAPSGGAVRPPAMSMD